MTPDALIRCEGLTKDYRTPSGSVTALQPFDTSVPEGGLTVIVGVSGSGKSTLLRMLVGLERPTAGSIRVAGNDLGALAPAALRAYARSVVTYVAQRPSDNLVHHLTLRQHTTDEESVDRIFAELGLAHRLDARPGELSGGEQARASFALALLRNTPLIVADEPTAELDELTAATVLSFIQAHAERGTTFVIATHDEGVVAAAKTTVEIGRHVVRPSSPARAENPVEAGTGVFGVRGLCKHYEGVAVVDDVDLELRAGELAVLLGRSGSGKSTLLMMMAGWQEPDSGSAELRAAAGVDVSTLGWDRIAYLPQRFGLVPELTIRENIESPARLQGSLERRSAAIDALVESLLLGDIVGRLPGATSIGQQQRAAIARALVLEPEVLFVDEPTSHQDASSRAAVWETLREATRRGATCLVATHEASAAEWADRLWEIGEGRVSEPGSAEG